MLHFNQRNWFRMLDEGDGGDSGSSATPAEPASPATPAGPTSPKGEKDHIIPAPSTAKEYYLAKIAGHTPTKKKVLFSGYGTYSIKNIQAGPASFAVRTIEIPALSTNENVTVMIGDQECQYAESDAEYANTLYQYMYSGSKIWIHVSSPADAANKVVIFTAVEMTPPQPKTATEFYLAKMAGIEVVDHLEKVLEQEFTLGTEPDPKGGYYIATITLDDPPIVNNPVWHIDGNNNSSLNVTIPNAGRIVINTNNASYAGTTHTFELFDKIVIEDVPVKTRTEQYLKAIAANQDSSDSSEADSPLAH